MLDTSKARDMHSKKPILKSAPGTLSECLSPRRRPLLRTTSGLFCLLRCFAKSGSKSRVAHSAPSNTGKALGLQYKPVQVFCRPVTACQLFFGKPCRALFCQVLAECRHDDIQPVGVAPDRCNAQQSGRMTRAARFRSPDPHRRDRRPAPLQRPLWALRARSRRS